jgi:hypothetical protein
VLSTYIFAPRAIEVSLYFIQIISAMLYSSGNQIEKAISYEDDKMFLQGTGEQIDSLCQHLFTILHDFLIFALLDLNHDTKNKERDK